MCLHHPARALTQVAGYGTHNTYLRSPEPPAVRVTPAQIVESVDASLKRLGTDYIDLLQVGVCACVRVCMCVLGRSPCVAWHYAACSWCSANPR